MQLDNLNKMTIVREPFLPALTYIRKFFGGREIPKIKKSFASKYSDIGISEKSNQIVVALLFVMLSYTL